MSKGKKFIINAIILIATSFIVKYIAVSFNVYISEKIGAEGMGIFQLLTSIYLLAITISCAGINLGTTRLVAEEIAFNRLDKIKPVVKRCIFYSTVASTLATVILCINADFIVKYWLHSKISVKSIYVLAISLPFMSLSSALDGYFTGVRRVVKTASADILEQITKIITVMFIFQFFVPKGLDNACMALALGSAAGEILSFVYTYILYVFDSRKNTPNYKNSSYLTKKLCKISIPVAFSSFIRSALGTFKQIIIPMGLEKSGVSCNKALAEYGMIRGMVMPIIMFPSALLIAFSELLIPEIAEKFVQHKNAHIKIIIERIFKITLIFSIAITVILFFYAKPLSMAIYKSYDTAHFIKILSLLVVIMYFDGIVDSILKGINKQVGVVAINIVDVLVSIALLAWLLPIFGTYGYIIVIFVSEILNGFLSIYKLLKATKVKIKIFNWIIIPIFLICFCVLISQKLIPNNLILSIFLCIVFYLFLLYVCKILKKEDFSL